MKHGPTNRSLLMPSVLLACDAIINLLLGIPLMLAPRTIIAVLGLPLPFSGFYPGILGAVMTGIGIALLIQATTERSSITGLGLEGAICLNLFGAGALAGWLLFGNLNMPLRGLLFLWGVVVIVLLLTGIELGCRMAGKNVSPASRG